MTNHTDLLRRALDFVDCPVGKSISKDDLEEWHQLKADLRTAIENGGWLPIETAPKDGRRVLLSLNVPYDADGIWTGFFTNSDWYVCFGKSQYKPSHWMPLPPPPNSPHPKDVRSEATMSRESE